MTHLREESKLAALPTAVASGVVFALAFGLRLLVPLTSRGLVGNYSYDAGVYYSSGAALVHGRVPYRDFILLHPPGVALAVAPAAWIGRLTTDHIGFAVAAVEFTALGAASAVLVVLVARGLGAGMRAATLGGLFYAAWFLSIRAEYVSRLEPLGNVLLLCGLLGYTRIEGRHGRRAALLCGAALGAAVSVKVWYGVPLLVVLGFLLVQRGRQCASRTALGAAAAVVVICGPFFALAPSAMWRMVFSEQLGRDQANPFRALVLLHRLPSGMSWPAAYLLDAVLLIAVGLLLMAAWRTPIVRLPMALLLSSVAVLLAAPSWFMFYVDYLTPALALCVAAGATAVALPTVENRRLWIRGCAAAGAAVVLLVLVGTAKAQWYRRGRPPSPLPPTQLASAVTGVRCVTSDSPMALIGLNALDRSLSNGCVDWVDVTGRTYGPDMDVRSDDGKRVPRVDNQRWQLALRDYLRSGDAVIIARPKDAGISPATWDAVRSGGVLARAGPTTVYTVAFTDRSVPSP